MSHRLAFVILIALVLIAAPGAGACAQDGGGDYTYTIVGGQDEPQTYADQTVDGFTFTHFTYRSLYPAGLEFKVTITPPPGVEINQVKLFYTFSTGKGGRVNAEPGENPGEWIAVPYSAHGLPPWHEVDAYWGVRTQDGQSIDTEPVHAVYYDMTREWYRAESQDVIVYWYGMPTDLGRYVLDGMAQNRNKYEQGFGILLPFQPLAIVFPPGNDWNIWRSGAIDDTAYGVSGTVIPEAASTIQRVRIFSETPKTKDCIWYDEADSSVEGQMQFAAAVVSHEVAHTYQAEVGVAGPLWWLEGQAAFYEAYLMYSYHDRLRTLAELRGGDLPTLQGDGPGGASSIEADGCIKLAYDMGASFMYWLVDTYGGMDTYRAVVAQMEQNVSVAEALEIATGKPFLELENEWRAFLGLGPVPPEVLDPALALSDPVEPFFAPGEEVVLPAAPFSQPIYNAPTEKSIADGACFANTVITILRAGHDGTLNWYEVDCMGMVGWMNQGQLPPP
jgi:hypothetical protein